MTKYSLGEIAGKVNGEVQGDPDVLITGVAGLEEAEDGDISFVANRRYHNRIASTKAAAVIVGEGNGAVPKDKNFLLVPNPYLTFLLTVELFHPQNNDFIPAVHPTAVVDPSARIGERVFIGPLAVVGAGAKIGDDVILQARSYVGERAEIGEKTRLMPGAIVLQEVKVGKRCLLQSGCVLGGDGFGFVCDNRGVQQKIPQVSGVVIGDDVEIGANTTIDRGTLSPTRIGNGVKCDNLVHIAHNVEIGDNSMVIAQVGISGSTKIGSSVIMAGQAGIGGHLTIGDRVKIGAQAGVTKSAPEASEISGYPARPHAESLRVQASLSRVPKLLKQFKELLERVKKLEDNR
ncbi:MAG: UDP-3-O-(3-hydroxymyristoyl)glucosamine N-acyltransferase [Candidatus Glassbacteria bacterium]|nr:UDP-3-O-(3-hydroxymyristoyl)glucosamine N-acyltransferase [Candidatus Glassbacteria bacterium]